MSFEKIQNIEEFNQAGKEEKKFYLLKNSTTCPISHEAYKQVEDYASENVDVPVFYLNVQESRELSNEIADTYKVKHESPQVLKFENDKITWDASHWNVTKSELTKNW